MCDRKDNIPQHDCVSCCKSCPAPKPVKKSNKVALTGVFMIDPIQPCPLPEHIQYLHLAGLQGLEFVKLPVDDKTDKFCLTSQVQVILGTQSMDPKFLDKLISDYNTGADPVKSRELLLGLVNLAKEYAKFIGQDFPLC